MTFSLKGAFADATRTLKGRWLLVLTSLAAALSAYLFVMLMSQVSQYAVGALAAVDGEEPQSALIEWLSVLMNVMSAVAAAVLFFPLAVGFKRVIWLLACGQTADAADIFWCYTGSRLAKVIMLKVAVFARLTAWWGTLALPAAALGVADIYLKLPSAVSVICGFMRYLMLGASVCLLAIKAITYSAADYIFMCNERAKCSDMIARSAAVTGMQSGNFGYAAMLAISFLPLFAVCAAVLPVFFVLPMFFAAYSAMLVRIA